MERNPEKERALTRPDATVGQRVRYWRKALGYKHQGNFAASIRTPDGRIMAQSTLSDLERGTDNSEFLPYIARKLGVDLDYLASGKGQPFPAGNGSATVNIHSAAIDSAAAEGDWPFSNIPRSRVERIRDNEVAMHFLESAMSDALTKIENSNRKRG